MSARTCQNCGKVIRKTENLSAAQYAQRRYCSRGCNTKGMIGAVKRTKTSGKNDWQKHALDTFQLSIAKKRGEAPPGTKFETTEEYLARGGKITQCPPMWAQGDLPVERAA